MSAAGIYPLEDLGVLRFRGPDARKFLQGQLSNDVSALRAGTLLRAGLHTPQGRTLALLALAAGAAEDEVLAILPRELLASVAATLARYVLRSKVKISTATEEHRIYGTSPLDAAPPESAPAPDSVAASGALLHGYGPGRGLILARASDPAPEGTPLRRTAWQALDIAAGLPQVYQASSGQFVAQMLNLDCIDAVSFDKGCYTGQEVIARAHFRGRVKRRMQRFLSAEPVRLVPGQSGRLADGRGFRVVDAIDRADGRCEFLAVAPLSASPHDAAADAASTTPAAEPAAPIAAEELALPYTLEQ